MPCCRYKHTDQVVSNLQHIFMGNPKFRLIHGGEISFLGSDRIISFSKEIKGERTKIAFALCWPLSSSKLFLLKYMLPFWNILLKNKNCSFESSY